MGTDIHIEVEVRMPNGHWRLADPQRDCAYNGNFWTYPGDLNVPKDLQVPCYHDRIAIVEWIAERYDNVDLADADTLCTQWEMGREVRWWDSRNYLVFTILAGVRRYGWRDAVMPISEPRGWPTPERGWPIDYDEMIPGVEHSCSWVTMRELEDYDWDQVVSGAPVEGDPAREIPIRRMCSGFLRFVDALRRLYRRRDTKAGDPGVGEDDVRLVFGFDN